MSKSIKIIGDGAHILGLLQVQFEVCRECGTVQPCMNLAEGPACYSCINAAFEEFHSIVGEVEGEEEWD